MADHPGKIVRQFLDTKGWTQDDLASVTGYSRQTVNGLISGKSRVTPDMAVALSAAFGNQASEWLQWDSEHQLSLVNTDAEGVQRRARMYELAPVSDMKKRGWIRDTDDPLELQKELDTFYGGSILDGVSFPVATRRTNNLDGLNAAEKAWCFMARHLSERLPVPAEFEQSRLGAAEKKLRQLAAYPREVQKLPQMLAYYGIRFVIVEPLPGAKIDGAAFWHQEQPVIAVSARWDRIDAFWFTVLHEFMHIKNGDEASFDANMFAESEKGIAITVATDQAEERANRQAAELLVPRSELDSFVGRVSPIYATTRLIQFANRIKMHPGIIVGQLQHRGELGYSAHRDLLVRVRNMVTETALTDGWGISRTVGVTDKK